MSREELKALPASVAIDAPNAPAGMVACMIEHMGELLPLWNPSLSGEENRVWEYARKALARMGRPAQEDTAGNLLSLGAPAAAGAPLRGIVAHTDSVCQGDDPGRQHVTLAGGVYRGDGSRPIGGDDKVGVAIALALAEYCPELSCVLTADEEVGGLGVMALVMPEHYLLVQCDRRGGSDMVTRITGPIMGREAAGLARQLLPHRAECSGMFTDVDVLSRRGLCVHATNLSCGYHAPHSAEEVVVLTQVIQALIDAHALLVALPGGLPAPERLVGGYFWGDEDEDDYAAWMDSRSGQLAPGGAEEAGKGKHVPDCDMCDEERGSVLTTDGEWSLCPSCARHCSFDCWGCNQTVIDPDHWSAGDSGPYCSECMMEGRR